VADVFVVTRRIAPAPDATVDLRRCSIWGSRAVEPPIVQAVATTGEGVEQLWDAISAHRAHLVDRRLGLPTARTRRSGSGDGKGTARSPREEFCRSARFDVLVREQTRAPDPHA
jgi:LAO/AO transport system kinase